MGATQSITDSFSTAVPAISIPGFLLNLGLVALLSYMVSLVYVRFGRSLSNRKSLARNFATIGMTTMIIITIVKSSLALSLGLVGALSIVRFRTAIKEPEELAFLFLTIAIGLGLGADQRLITILGTGVILAMISLRARVGESGEQSSLYLVVGQAGSPRLSLERVTALLREHCSGLSLVRFDESEEALEASFRVQFDDYGKLEQVRSALRRESETVTVSFVDNEGLA
jgi:uncharacterized membrane protein YhiD involved in acid resistance